MQSKTISRLAAAALLPLVAFAPTASAAASLADALDAYRNNRVVEAESMLREVAADASASARDRATALRELGRIDGLVRGETDAMAQAMAGTPGGEERCTTAALALRRLFGPRAHDLRRRTPRRMRLTPTFSLSSIV